MASPAFAAFLLVTLLSSSLAVHARQSHFFSKVSADTANPTTVTVTPTNDFQQQQQQQPSFVQETDNNGYGLYRHQTPETTAYEQASAASTSGAKLSGGESALPAANGESNNNGNGYFSKSYFNNDKYYGAESKNDSPAGAEFLNSDDKFATSDESSNGVVEKQEYSSKLYNNDAENEAYRGNSFTTEEPRNGVVSSLYANNLKEEKQGTEQQQFGNSFSDEAQNGVVSNYNDLYGNSDEQKYRNSFSDESSNGVAKNIYGSSFSDNSANGVANVERQVEDSDVRKAKVAAQRENTKLSVLKKITKQKCGGLKVAAANVSEKRKKKKKKFVAREHRKSASTLRKKSSHKSENTDGSLKQEALCDEVNFAENDEKCNGSLSISGNLTPFGPDSSSKGFASSARKKVRETLRLFHFICRKLVHESESRSKKGGRSQGLIGQRVDCIAAKELRNRGMCLNEGQCIVGDLPGVEVGDEFQFRLELNVIGLHRPTQAGIDFAKQGRDFIAVSIVASAGYDDNLENSDVLDYTGQGGNSTKDKEAEDQKLEKGNLGLKNSIATRNPVRVIHGYTKKLESGKVRSKVYVYDGLYNVEKYWQEPGPHGKLVFKFRLVRIPGQPELTWKQVKKSKKLKLREGLCVSDISQGKELIPICAVNTVDNEKPPSFSYITKIMYPNTLAAPDGCGCRTGCSESGSSCSCVARNGREIPFNNNGAIVEAKDLVYECGSSCKCPSSCYNRVSQNGIKIQLEVFKTDSRGWGVRSLNSISSGSFICEYVGELLDDVEAERRTNDEYLFDIGGCSDDDDSEGNNGSPNFTIDAAEFGNVGRFINHSCSPNLYAQNVLYDHGDRRIPHIMLFAAENIPPLRELTYHYNYQIDQVRDSQGNIKMKSCYCGSSECTGRMY